GAQGAVLVATEGAGAGETPVGKALQRAVEECGVPLLRGGRLTLVGRADGQGVEVDVAGVVLVVAQRDGVRAGLELEVAGHRAPRLPVTGARQLPRPDLLAVEVERHALGALERVRAVGVAQVGRVGARLVDGGGEEHLRAHGQDALREAGAGVAYVLVSGCGY